MVERAQEDREIEYKMPRINIAAKKALKTCLALKEKEKLLIITDSRKRDIAAAFFDEGKKLCSNVMMLNIPVGKVNGEEPPQYVAEMMKRFDVIIAPTTISITHTMAVKNARKQGRKARVASLPSITAGILIRGMNSDYNLIEKRSRRINIMLKKARIVRITTAKGTDIAMQINRKAGMMFDSGFVKKKGSLANLPAGEAGFVPKHGSAEGVFVVDASIGGIGKVDKDVRITVKKGRAVSIKGARSAYLLKKMLKRSGKNSANIAELGIGTNDSAIISGMVLEDEKVFGTAHIALGNSKGLGGKTYAKCHLDCVFRKPTIHADSRMIIKEGKLL